MKITVIGHKGVVGNATYYLLNRLGHTVAGADVGDKVPKAQIYMICTPEEAVPSVVHTLYNMRIYSGLVVIRSTVPIGTCDTLLQEVDKRFHICHWPEHLKEGAAVWQCYYPAFNNIGECCETHGDMLAKILQPLAVPLIRSDHRTSEASKLAINNLKSTLISYWNEFWLMSQNMEFNPHLAARIAQLNPDIPQYGTLFGSAYGGKCLPKDLKQTLKSCDTHKFDAQLLQMVEEVNKKMMEISGESGICTA